MIAHVEGVVNGLNVSLKRVKGDQWETTIPESLNGVYVVELTAYDEAGNMDHVAKYILAYDPTNLCASLIPYPYFSKLETNSYKKEVMLSDYYGKLVKSSCQGRDRDEGCI